MTEGTDIQLVYAKLDLLTEKVSNIKVHEKKEPQPWYAILTGVLGVPALLLVMVLNFSQYRSNNLGSDKTMAETEKTRLEIAQLRTKTDELKSVQDSQDIQALKRALQDTVPLLQQSAARLESHPVSSEGANALIVRYLIIWAFLSFVHAIFAVFFLGWDLVSQIPSSLFNWLNQRLRLRERETETRLNQKFKGLDNYELQRVERAETQASFERQRNRLLAWVQWSSTIIRMFPRIFEVSLQVAIFSVLIVPMFDLAAGQIGSNIRFAQVSSSAKHLQVRKTLAYVRELVATPRSTDH